MRYAPKWHNKATPIARRDGVYYEDYCCRGCFWDWGIGFAELHLYKHDCNESNYLGKLKKYWKTSAIDYFSELDDNKEDV